MDSIDENISRNIKRIAGTLSKNHSPIMMGKVRSVDVDSCTCSVELTTDDADNPTPSVLFNSILNNTMGLLIEPAIGSTVWVAEIDGEGKYGIVKYGEITKVTISINETKLTITNSEIVLNDGSLGGLIKIESLVQKVNALENDINTLKQIFTAWSPIPNDGGAALKTAAASWYAALLNLTVVSDLENPKIKHG